MNPSTSIPEISVFFPAFNEEDNIEKTVNNAIKVLEDLKINWEIIIVNDGSKDNTASIADKIAGINSKIKVIHQINGGYGMALRTGFKNSKYDWICYTDSDGQFDFAEITKFMAKALDADYVLGYRIKRNDPFFRLVLAKIWALSVFILFGIWVKDIDCGFKMISKIALERIGKLESTRGAMINAELLIKVKKSKLKVAQVGVNHYPRQGGQPTGSSLKVAVKSYIELLKMAWKINIQNSPNTI